MYMLDYWVDAYLYSIRDPAPWAHLLECQRACALYALSVMILQVPITLSELLLDYRTSHIPISPLSVPVAVGGFFGFSPWLSSQLII